ncbi:MAG: hypothetical protein H8E21_14105 [Gammaproteobacteria bacterium]|nr:hypothetical protein [Gammaproteobacteria bacterium]MBL6998380.1 hypothetical protein [Gammaproteobacteria bacterium]
MKQDISLQLMVVMLENLVQHTLPRIYAIREKLEQGHVLLKTELNFMLESLQTVSQCYSRFQQDIQCMVIFSSVAELLSEVIEMAFNNEQDKFQYVA